MFTVQCSKGLRIRKKGDCGGNSSGCGSSWWEFNDVPTRKQANYSGHKHTHTHTDTLKMKREWLAEYRTPSSQPFVAAISETSNRKRFFDRGGGGGGSLVGWEANWGKPNNTKQERR